MSKELENEVMETEEVVEETLEVTEITTKDAFCALGHNAIKTGKKFLAKVTPIAKKAVIVGSVIVGTAVIVDKFTGQKIEKQSDDWTDDTLDIVDGEAIVTETAAEAEVTETEATENEVTTE